MDGLPVITTTFPQGRSWVKQEKLQAKRKQRIQLTPGRCGKSQNVTSVVSLSICHINASCSMQVVHFMTRFFPHEISLMNIEMQYWNFQCRNIPQRSASPCSHWTVFFSWFVMITFRATILPNNSCVNISNGCERYLQLIAHALICTLLLIRWPWKMSAVISTPNIPFVLKMHWITWTECSKQRLKSSSLPLLALVFSPVFSACRSCIIPVFFTKGVSVPAQSCSGSHARIRRNLSKGCD